MKFRLAPNPQNHDALDNPKTLLATGFEALAVRGMLVGVVPAALVYLLCLAINDNETIFFWLREPIWVILAIFAVVTVVHECAHVLVSPGLGSHPENIVGIDRKTYTPYVAVQAPMKKWLAIAHALAPMLLLTPFFIGVSAIASAEWRGIFAMAAIFNCAGAGGDLLIAWRMHRVMGDGDNYQSGFFGKPKDQHAPTKTEF